MGFDIDNPKDVYVVCAERDGFNPDDSRNQPIAWETLLDRASLIETRRHQQKLGNRYGKTRIAKLVFLDEDNLIDGGGI